MGKRFDAETYFEFVNTNEEEDGRSCYIHTSCSVPLVQGDRIGPFEVLGGNECIPPPEGPYPCIEATVIELDDGRTAINVTFDYSDLSPDRDFVANCDPRDQSG